MAQKTKHKKNDFVNGDKYSSNVPLFGTLFLRQSIMSHLAGIASLVNKSSKLTAESSAKPLNGCVHDKPHLSCGGSWKKLKTWLSLFLVASPPP